MSFIIYLRCFNGIVLREALRFVHQKERFFSALVRPLVWLGIFAAGFRSVLGVSIIPPYETYIPYEVYIAPGLIAMIQLFNGMQSSLSMDYDREMGSMKPMLVSPIPRCFLLISKLLAGVFVSILQVYAFLVIFGIGCVGRHHNRPNSHNSQITNRPFRTVFCADNHPVAGIHPGSHQHRRQFTDIMIDLGPTQPLPTAVNFTKK